LELGSQLWIAVEELVVENPPPAAREPASPGVKV
jgi:hypothetical protein